MGEKQLENLTSGERIMSLEITSDMLKEWQSWTLDRKIAKSKQTIRDWYNHNDGKVYIAFSGGKDSSVLLHLIRTMYPEVPAVFSNTGLEFPELVKFARSVDNVEEIRPVMTFKEIVEKHGFPLISKLQAEYIERFKSTKSDKVKERLLGRDFIGRDGRTQKARFAISEKWQKLITAPFKTTSKCCKILKKDPFKIYNKRTGLKAYVGTMASESEMRRRSFLKTGCINYGQNLATPIAHWNESDIWDYIAAFQVPHCAEIYKDYKRTGCVFCAYGAHMEKGEGRFQKLKRTHPKLHKYCMDKLGFREPLEFIGVETE